jgi:hypothetical protein
VDDEERHEEGGGGPFVEFGVVGEVALEDISGGFWRVRLRA